MKTLDVYYKSNLAGHLTRDVDDTFRFQYEENYLESDLPAISCSLRKKPEEFVADHLFPFFDGLIPEGWLLKLATDKLRLNPLQDRFELLENLCHDTIGAVSIGDRPTVTVDPQRDDLSSIQLDKTDRCMICYEILGDTDDVYHPSCMKRVFQKPIVPIVDLNKELVAKLANHQINKKLAVSGVQRKLSLDFAGTGKTTRLTMTDMWGRFIFKPEGEAPHLPANEHLCLRLAAAAGIQTEDAALIPVTDGTLGFIARRFDRGRKNERYHQEDFCQILRKESYKKYSGSIEQIGKALKEYSDFPGDNLYRLLEVTVFHFLVGNVDAHLKNFSLVYESESGLKRLLSPGYDFLSTDLYLDDQDETALAINGKKGKLVQKDFLALTKNLGFEPKILINVIENFASCKPSWCELVTNSFLPEEKKEEFIKLIDSRMTRLE